MRAAGVIVVSAVKSLTGPINYDILVLATQPCCIAC